MKKVEIDTDAFLFPMPMAILGTSHSGKDNFMAVAWITHANESEPMIAFALSTGHLTTEAMTNNSVFSLNIPSSKLVEKTDCVGLVSGRNADKASLFEVTRGKLDVPLITECAVNAECKVHKTVELGSDILFVAKIERILVNQDIRQDKGIDFDKLQSFVLTMPDKAYRTIGEPFEKAWKAGQSLKKELRANQA